MSLRRRIEQGRLITFHPLPERLESVEQIAFELLLHLFPELHTFEQARYLRGVQLFTRTLRQHPAREPEHVLATAKRGARHRGRRCATGPHRPLPMVTAAPPVVHGARRVDHPTAFPISHRPFALVMPALFRTHAAPAVCGCTG